MPMTCRVCRHPQRTEMERRLLEGASYREIALQFGVSHMALHRHRAHHLPAHLARAHQAAQAAQADDLLAQARHLQAKALAILDRAERAGDLRTALAAIAQARGTLELLARLLGELDERPQTNILVTSPEWLALRGRLLSALDAYPEAKAAVAEALRDATRD